MDLSSSGSRYKCLFETTHVYTASKLVVIYHVAFGCLVALVALPFLLWNAVLSIVVGATAATGLYRRNSSLLTPLLVHVHLTLLLLLFLGGFVFFANIFYTNKDPDKPDNPNNIGGLMSPSPRASMIFLMDTERFAILLHLLNVLLLLFHMWHIYIISSCRKFFDAHRLLTFNSLSDGAEI